MKASRAYIASLGTSGVLIAFFLLLLAVVSAIVAFRGYPGEASNDGLDRLDVRGSSEAASVSQATRAGSREGTDGSLTRRRGGVRGLRAAGRSGAAKGLRSEGGVAGGRVGGGSTPGSPAGDGTGRGAGDDGRRLPSLPVGGDGDGQLPQAPSAGDVVGGVGDTVDDATGDLGGNVGRTAPQLEAPVVETGEAVGGVVEETAPKVDEVVGGVTDQVGGVTDQVGGVTDTVGDATDTVGGVTDGLP